MRKNQKMGLGPTKIPLKFEINLDHHLDKKIWTFPSTYYYIPSGFPQTFVNWIQGLFKDFQGQQQQFSRIYFKARPPLPSIPPIKILYCQMILTFCKLITTMLVNTSNNISI